jgi:phosphoribosyl 1,2-cyclic phosphodiesterase/CheY-like chemotaxis protein
VCTPDGTPIVLDCGTGAHALGQALLASGSAPSHGHIFISHTHWDHIQGFPFFGPLFTAGHEWDVYAPLGLGKRLRDALAGQMDFTYFPVTLGQLDATLRYHEIGEGVLDVGGARVVAHYLNHPGLALGYRIETQGAAVVYATDHEPYWLPPGAEEATLVAHRQDRRHVEFLTGADLVIHDSQYTLEEYRGKIGWGHTPAEKAVDYALVAGVKRLALFHHDPMRTDDGLDQVVDVCRKRVVESGGRLEVFAAAEGQVVELLPNGLRSFASDEPPAVLEPSSLPDEATVLVVGATGSRRLVEASLDADQFRVLAASDADGALVTARSARPDVVLLDGAGSRGGVDVWRALRAHADPCLRHVPVIMVVAAHEGDPTQALSDDGLTDSIHQPAGLPHLRARVQAWLMRSRQRKNGSQVSS